MYMERILGEGWAWPQPSNQFKLGVNGARAGPCVA